MQIAPPDAIDITREPEHIHKLYGIGDKRCDHFAKQLGARSTDPLQANRV